MEKTRITVLIVEDDTLLAMVEERLLQKLGCDVIANVTNGKQAIEKAKQLEPDLILMDISLAGVLDGIDAIERIREFTKTPVIYLSGSAERYHYERAKKTGFWEYLTKPVRLEDVKSSIDRIFNDSESQENSSPEISDGAGQYNISA